MVTLSRRTNLGTQSMLRQDHLKVPLMCVVAGSARGKKLLVVPGHGTRLILDRVKTAFFDILRPRIAGTRVLDLFAGSGSVGIEALSQGAAHSTFIDATHKAIATIKKNLATTSLSDRAEVRQADAFGYLRGTKRSFDLIYIAPPQYKGLWGEAMQLIAERPGVLNRPSAESDEPGSSGLAIVQIDPREYQSLHLTEIRETRQKRYGNTLLVFFDPRSVPASISIHEGGVCGFMA
jgi:16S rRNA (guanine966-N2)-methyltransferase